MMIFSIILLILVSGRIILNKKLEQQDKKNKDLYTYFYASEETFEVMKKFKSIIKIRDYYYFRNNRTIRVVLTPKSNFAKKSTYIIGGN